MVAAYSAAASEVQQQHQQHKLEENGRAPLALSEKNNGIPRKPKNREVTSRYKTATTSYSAVPPASSRRCPSPSPTLGRSITTPEATSSLKRAQSAERRRPSPLPTSDSRAANGLVEAAKRTPGRGPEGLLWPSTRSLSVSMQRDSISTRDHTLKPAANVVQKTGDSVTNLQRKGTPERKVTPERKGTPDRKRTPRRPSRETENARPVDNSHSKPDQQRWPGKSTSKVINAMTRSVDLTDRSSRASSLLVPGQSTLGTTRTPRSAAVNRAFQRSINEVPVECGTSTASRRVSFDGRLRSPSKGIDHRFTETSDSPSGKSDDSNQTVQPSQEVELSPSSVCTSATMPQCDITSDDTESVSSGGNSVVQEAVGSNHRSGSGGNVSTRRGTTVPARFWQETNNRLHRASGLRSSLPDSDLTSGFLKSAARLKVIPSTGSVINGPERATASPRFANRSQVSSPFTGTQHPSSPGKVIASMSSPARSQPSPTRMRLPPSLPSGNSLHTRSHNSSSMLSFGIDTRKGKKGTGQLEEAHNLRILHNRLLQWRFVNGKAEAAMNAQRVTAEKLLSNVWFTTSELADSVTMKNIQLQQLRLENKLASILKGQMSYLEEWAMLERDHTSSLLGAVEALEATTLRLPVTGGARADTQAVKEAVRSAVDVMKAMGSSVRLLLPKLQVEGMNHLVSELADVAAQEKSLLEECADLLTTAVSMEVEESSLRAHLVQLKQTRYLKEQASVSLLLNVESNSQYKEIC